MSSWVFLTAPKRTCIGVYASIIFLYYVKYSMTVLMYHDSIILTLIQQKDTRGTRKLIDRKQTDYDMVKKRKRQTDKQ